MKTFGTILLLLGFLFIVFAGFQIADNKLGILDLQQISNPDIVSLYWSPITAIALIVAGIMVLFISKKEGRTSGKVSHH